MSLQTSQLLAVNHADEGDSTSRIVTFANRAVHKAVLVGILIGASALLDYPRLPDASAAPPLSSGLVAESPSFGSAGIPSPKAR